MAVSLCSGFFSGYRSLSTNNDNFSVGPSHTNIISLRTRVVLSILLRV